MLGKVQASLTLPSLKRAFQGCISSATSFSRKAKGQKLATLKQSALFNAFLLHSVSRCGNEAGEPCGWQGAGAKFSMQHADLPPPPTGTPPSRRRRI